MQSVRNLNLEFLNAAFELLLDSHNALSQFGVVRCGFHPQRFEDLAAVPRRIKLLSAGEFGLELVVLELQLPNSTGELILLTRRKKRL